MPFTNEDWLPSYEDLSVPEIGLSSAPLRAGAHQFGKYCDNQCKEFMLCTAEERDPRKCFNEGNEVSRCALEFFQKVKSQCAAEFTRYWKCVDMAGSEMQLRRCRKTQESFDKCVLDKLDQERPGLGYFSKLRVHHTTRPKPVDDPKMPEALPDPPKYDPKQPPPESIKYGTRGLI